MGLLPLDIPTYVICSSEIVRNLINNVRDLLRDTMIFLSALESLMEMYVVSPGSPTHNSTHEYYIRKKIQKSYPQRISLSVKLG